MATVEEYRRNTQLRPSNQKEIRVGTSDATFGAGVGQAVAGAGEVAFKIADAIDYKQQLEGDAKAREAFNAYRYGQREEMRAPEKGFLNRTGSNAQGIQQTAEERLRSLRERHAEGLDPRALQKYNDMVDGLQDQAHTSILAHTSNESRNYIVNQRQSTVDGYIEEAASNWHDQDLFDENLGLALQEQTQLANLQGWDAATQKQAAEDMISKTFRNRIVMAASEDPEAAQELLENSRDILSAEDEHALDTGLESLVIEAKAEKFTQGFIRRGSAVAVVSGDTRYVRNDAFDRPDDGVETLFRMTASRPNRPNQEIIDVVTTAVERTFGAGSRVVVTSGTEHVGDQHGAERHQTGMAVDVAVFRPDGSQVLAGDEDGKQFARESVVSGALGVGFGEGYMGGKHFHIDSILPNPAKGEAHTWGTQGAAMRPELVALMDRGAALVLQDSAQANTIVNRQIISKLGDVEGKAVIAAAEMSPSIPADVALSAEVMAANPKFAGMTVGEVYDSIATAIGDDPASRMGRSYFDAQRAYEAALDIEDPKLRKQVLDNINTMTAMQDNARREGRREAADEAWDNFVTTGDTNVPLETRQRMGQGGWAAFQSAVKGYEQGELTTDPDTWEILTRMSSSNRREFANLLLSGHRKNLTRADYERFVVLQEAAKADLRGEKRDIEDGRVNIDFGKADKYAQVVYEANAAPIVSSLTEEQQKQHRLRYRKDVARLVEDFYDREQREPNEREVIEMAAVMALPISYVQPGAGLLAGGFDGLNADAVGTLSDASMRATGTDFTIEVDYNDIPLSDRQRIARQLMAATNGEVPSPDDIVETYEQQLLISVGLPPNIDIEAVPARLIEIEKADNPDVSDDEIVEKYQLFLMSQ